MYLVSISTISRNRGSIWAFSISLHFMKTCSKCLISKSLDQFFIMSRSSDRRGSQCKSCAKDYYNSNKEAREKYRLKWRSDNKIKINESIKRRRKHDIQFRLSGILRHRIGKIIKRNQRSGSSIKDLGCTLEFLKEYLESQFKPGMSWENYGRGGWHIDHIRPLNSFDLSKREDFLKACNYTNLQPLWEEDNMRKGDKYDYTTIIGC